MVSSSAADPSAKGLADSVQSIMENNGGSIVAMIGKDCVAIASDLRLGNGAVGVAHNFDKVSSDTLYSPEEAT